MRSSALILGIGLVNVGWATGGGAAQVLFGLFGEVVFERGATGIGIIWGCAGIGLIIGAMVAHRLSRMLSFEGYKRTISICYIVHGGSYVLFALSPTFALACFFIGLSRLAVAISSTQNMAQLLRHVDHDFRGRVFSTIETWMWMTMMVSMALAGVASDHMSPRVIGVFSGVLSSLTAFFWAWANYTGRLPEPAIQEPETAVEIHGDPTV
jgi:predicted MFS family arabinose efflux permease